MNFVGAASPRSFSFVTFAFRSVILRANGLRPLIVHSTHTRSTARMSMCFFLLGLVGDDTLGGQQHTCNGSSIFEGDTSNLGGVDNPGLQQVLIFFRPG